MSIFDDVEKFMKACGQPTPNTPISQDNPTSVLYKELIREEWQEWLEADGHSDDTERLDAIFDVMWVMIAYAMSRGWDIRGAWEEGASSNLSKIDPETGVVLKNEIGKVMKPAGFKRPNFKQFVQE